ncbi:hypothetical protein NP233_g1790 [Leucocoprinus birnbaumii]|uniref:TEA domain-containing protein n=1 Tax=Leucocoprinus birnbaumii TaxID=56174 RepID=A0AAD5W1Y4_9AGAR|nr:hypothetical protein NP233_g1790 [Leucocoprinus birnbaumii]
MTVDDLSLTYTAAQADAVKDQQKATGRRCHKTLKGGSEAVWSPRLEAALIAGLQLYSDRHRVHMRHRGRFIGRNHFLASYVKSVTGKRRTAKQVGSHLQQLKETCIERDILWLITGSRSSSPSHDRRQRTKSKSKISPQRSVSSSLEPYDEASEYSPYSHSTLEYTPLIESPQYISSPTDLPTSTICEQMNQVSIGDKQYSTIQDTPSQYYSDQNRGSYVSQTSNLTYSTPIQQWGSYFATVTSQQEQQYAYYGFQYN